MEQKLILKNLKLSSRANQKQKYSGIDSIKHCLNLQHFLSYPHNIDYQYNSRGFRDQEWPDTPDELRNAIWCIGDSFTVGLGSPLEHTWPYQLQSATGIRTINISMDGASNQWISRIAQQIIDEINPKQMVIMWSYTHRREHPDDSLNDEDRRLPNINSSDSDDWENFLTCKQNINSASTKIVHFSIPNFYTTNFDLYDTNLMWDQIKENHWPAAPRTINELEALPPQILEELKNLHNIYDEFAMRFNLRLQSDDVILVYSQDIARDGHHFDLITAEWVASQAALNLNY